MLFEHAYVQIGTAVVSTVHKGRAISAAAMERTASQQQAEDSLKAVDAVREMRRGVSFKDVLEEGHAAAGLTFVIAITTGLTLGLLLPKDQSIPGKAC